MVGKAVLIYEVITLQYLVVLLGLGWGWLAFREQGLWEGWLTFWLAPGAISVALLGLASFRSNRERSGWVAPALASYAVILMRMEPFVEVYDWPQLLFGVGAIMPPLLCIKSLVRSHTWLAVCGVVLFSATSVACLSFNVMANTWGVEFGFFASPYREVR